MATYLVLNLAVLLFVAAAVLLRIHYRARPFWIALAVLLALTLVFDNLIIMAGIVAYDPALISGIKLYKAPIEDFAYSIAALLLMPLLWKVLGKRRG